MRGRTINVNKEEDVNSSTGIRLLVLVVVVLSLLIISIIGGTLLGAADLSVETVLDVWKSKFFGADSDVAASSVYIVWDLRMPRTLLAIAAGGGLAICGAAMQSITQNVLAEPYVLGVSSGASMMVSIAFFLGLGSTSILTQGFAFVGAMMAMILVYAIGNIGMSGSGTRLVLAGMAISIIFNAATQFFISISSAQTTASITMWMMGSLAQARWSNIGIPLIASALGLIYFFLHARAYNLISLGDETATSMGVDVAKLKKWTTIVVAFVTGVIVASCGIIGLVGFIIPHIVRMIIGADHRRLFPVSYIVGCLFIVWMDILARFVMAPQEVPIGIFTALCGGPLFIWLLYRQAVAEKR